MVGDSGLFSLAEFLLLVIAFVFYAEGFFTMLSWSFVLAMRFNFAFTEVFGARTVIYTFSPSTAAGRSILGAGVVRAEKFGNISRSSKLLSSTRSICSMIRGFSADLRCYLAYEYGCY